MRLTTVILIASLLQVSAATFGQRITLNRQNVPLKTVLKEIREQSGYNFFYDGDILNNNIKTSVNLQGVTIEQAVQKALDGLSLTYEIENKIILIKKKQPSFLDKVVERIKAPFSAIDLRGRIVNAEGQPVAGANVTVKGTKISTISDQNGLFSLNGVDNGATLVISYIGYKTQEIPAKANLGNIALELSDNPLDEVQVIAYGTTTRRLSTGNIGTVKAKDIENQPVTNPLLALQGRVPGLVITQQTGVPGGGVIVRIQGQNSIRSGNTPLYVVDGVPIESFLQKLNGALMGNSGVEYDAQSTGNEGNPLNYLNPADIESINILKDADATAIYGSRAANGAILISTKKGNVGKMQLDATVNSGWGYAPYNKFKMLNTREYLDMRYEAYKNDGIDWRASNVNAPDLKLWDTTRYTNWQKELLSGTARMQQARISVSGGNNAMQYRLAGTYNKASSVFPDQGNGNPIGTLSANINSISANQRLRMSWTVNYQYNHNEMPSGNFLNAALLLPPNAPDPFNTDGTINWAPNASGSSTYLQNPYVAISNVYTNTTRNMISNLGLSYKLWKDLELSTSLGYTNMQTEDFSPRTMSSIQPDQRSIHTNYVDYGNRNNSSWIAEPQLRYAFESRIGKFDLLLGSTFNERTGTAQRLRGLNYSSDELLKNISSATTVVPSSSGQFQYKYLAYFSRLNYNLKNEVILNLSFRRDGSSRFGKDRRFGDFWSVGSAWVFSKQKIVRNLLPFLSFGKLRASYGVTGNDQIGDFQFMQTYSFYSLQIPYQGIPGLSSNGVPNPELAWERNRKFSSGIDLGFLDDLILLDISYSQNSSGNQLVQYPLATMTGAFGMFRNLEAVVLNTTWEFSLTSRNINQKDFEWSTSFNTSIARNKLVRYPGLEQSSYAQEFEIGEPIDMRYLHRFAGVNAATGEYQFLDKHGNPTSNPANEDRIKRSQFPPFYGGVQNRLRWKRFSLDFHIQLVKQWGGNINYGLGTLLTPGRYLSSSGGNQPSTVLQRWRKVGDQAITSKYSTLLSIPDQLIAFSDAQFTTASFARLKHLSLSCRLPDRWVKEAGFTTVNLTASGQNLLTVTNYEGPDPETQSLTALPPLRSFNLGIQVVF